MGRCIDTWTTTRVASDVSADHRSLRKRALFAVLDSHLTEPPAHRAGLGEEIRAVLHTAQGRETT